MGELAASVRGGPFGVTLVSYSVYQHPHCQVTQPLVLEQLREWGIDISAGQIDALLTGKHEPFHEEKDALLPAAYVSASYLTVDDTGARHRGQNGYTTHIGNELFAWFGSTQSKSRINFLQLLRGDHEDYRVDEEALAYMQGQKLPQGPLERLRTHSEGLFTGEAHWNTHLTQLGITQERHRRIATEGALLGSVLHHGFPKELPIVSDDAGQFKILCHGLCWVHAERLIHTLVPLNPTHRQELAEVRSQLWELYADLKAYKAHPSPEQKIDLEARFDALFTTPTSFETLNQTLRRVHRKKAELLLVLDRPDIALHNNGSERDLRDPVKKRKVSGGAPKELGGRRRDTLISLKRTCRKVRGSFLQYLTDRHPIPTRFRHSLTSFSSGLLLTTERPALLRSYNSARLEPSWNEDCRWRRH